MWQLLLGLSAGQFFQLPLTPPRGYPAQVLTSRGTVAAASFAAPPQQPPQASAAGPSFGLALCVAAPAAALAYYFTSASRTPAPTMHAWDAPYKYSRESTPLADDFVYGEPTLVPGSSNIIVPDAAATNGFSRPNPRAPTRRNPPPAASRRPRKIGKRNKTN